MKLSVLAGLASAVLALILILRVDTEKPIESGHFCGDPRVFLQIALQKEGLTDSLKRHLNWTNLFFWFPPV